MENIQGNLYSNNAPSSRNFRFDCTFLSKCLELNNTRDLISDYKTAWLINDFVLGLELLVSITQVLPLPELMLLYGPLYDTAHCHGRTSSERRI